MAQHTTQKMNIAVIGCGKMGGALIQNWVNADLLQSAQILDPNDIDESLTSHPDLFHVKLMESISFDKIDAIILAVKPQILENICHELRPYINAHSLIISIAAGKSLSFFEQTLGTDKAIIRAMPNTPASIGKGASVLCGNVPVSNTHKQNALALFNASGLALWLEDETHMNAVTALSGSGPAYLFYMVEAMSKAGEVADLPSNMAKDLARQTIIGAASLLESAPDMNASILRQNVTSPNGTTQAGLEVLMNGDFQEIMTRTVTAAKERGQALDKGD